MLFSEIGYIAMLAAFVLAILQWLIPMLGVFTQRAHLQNVASSLSIAAAAALCVSFAGLVAAFLLNDFSLLYVAAQSNTLMPWVYKLSATWGGHEGSLLLWVTILALWSALVGVFSKPLPLAMRARVLSVLGLILAAMLALVIFSSSPFARSLPMLPVDGGELNPLLQDPGLILHPPTLYMGYVGLSVPFAFAMAALWAGRLDAAWTRWMRPWTLVAWGFLTLGIALGSWWAYYELGWGGWWFWDPVENASFMPWLAATALIHSLAVTEKRGVFKAWTIMLAILAFALSLLGTFLVRSGVLTSVHSFAADPTRGLFVLVILALTVGGALSLFALRGWRLTAESQYGLRSRESLLAMNNILLVVGTTVVFLGTLYPIIADAFRLGQVSVGPPYFNALFAPLTWILLLLLVLAPVTRWKKDTQPLLGAVLAIAATSAVLALAIVWVWTGRFGELYALALTLFLSFWVLGFMLKDVKDKTRHAGSFWSGLAKLRASYWAMTLAHIGLLVTCIGIAATSATSVEKDVALKVGESVTVKDYEFTLQSVQDTHAGNYDATQATVLVRKNGARVARLAPEKRHYVVSRQVMTEAAISANLWRDLYVALGEPLDDSNHQAGWAVRVYVKPFVRWLWLGALIMVLGSVLAIIDKRYRKSVN